MSLDLEEQYEKIYCYCYFKVNQREIAEDITQETFLRFLESSDYVNNGKAMQYLYTIARNLCVDEYRKRKIEVLSEKVVDKDVEDSIVTRIFVRMVLSEMDETDRELLLLRYVNEVPVSVICKIYGVSRFTIYRRVLQAVKTLKEKLGKEFAV